MNRQRIRADALRQAVMLTERGSIKTRNDAEDVLELADIFLEWIEGAE